MWQEDVAVIVIAFCEIQIVGQLPIITHTYFTYYLDWCRPTTYRNLFHKVYGCRRCCCVGGSQPTLSSPGT